MQEPLVQACPLDCVPFGLTQTVAGIGRRKVIVLLIMLSDEDFVYVYVLEHSFRVLCRAEK